MLIKPLQDRMTVIETSQKEIEEKVESIQVIRKENEQLRNDCNMIKHENEILKTRIEKIESKLITNNVILHGIEDQAWKLKDIIVISTLANGKTTKDKLDIVQNVGFKDIRRIGDYNSRCPRAILVEFEKKASADFLLENKKGLPKGVYVDRKYTPEVENEHRKLHPILRKAKTLPDYKMKSKLEGIN